VVRPLLLAAALLLALPSSARAQLRGPDPDRDPVGFLVAALRYRLDVLDVAPYDAAAVLGPDWQPLTFGLRLDVRRRHMRLRLGVGDQSVLAVGLRADVAVVGATSRVRARLDLGIAGHGLSLRLPDVVIVPRFVRGRVVVEYQIPLIEKRF
jgi:hypothetical protein